MVGFGNPRYEGGGGGSGGGGGGSKWLPPSLSNKLDNLNVLPKAPKTTAAGRGMRNDDVSITGCVSDWHGVACTAEDLCSGCLRPPLCCLMCEQGWPDRPPYLQQSRGGRKQPAGLARQAAIPAAKQGSGPQLAACCSLCCRRHPQHQSLLLAWIKLPLSVLCLCRNKSCLQVNGRRSSDERDPRPPGGPTA